MKKGILYFIGCGPGDRKLITIKGEDALKKSSVVFYFPPFNEVFYDIVKTKQQYFFFKYTFNEIKEIVIDTIEKGENVAFMVPGDLSIFSPFSSFLNYFNDIIEIIPGIGTFNYFSAKLKKILNPAGTVFSVTILGTKLLHEKIGDFEFEDFINEKTTLIIYMNDMNISDLSRALLKVYSASTSIFVGINLASKKEEIFSGNLSSIAEKLKDCNIEKEKFVTIIVGNISEMPLNIEWWDNKVAEANKL